MKTTLKFKLFLTLVIEHPLLSAMIFIFSVTVLIMATLMIYHQDDSYILMTQITKVSFWTLAILAVAHFAITKIFITRFSHKKNRIMLLYHEGKTEIYNKPVFSKKISYAEIIFPNDWSVAHTIGEHQTSLFIRVDISSQETFYLYFNLKVETFGEFRAQDLEKLITLQKAKFPNKKKFEFIDCLEDFLIADCLRNHHSMKALLDDYHYQQINLKGLEAGILQMVKIPSLFTNVKNVELRLSEVQRIVILNPKVRSFSFNKTAAAAVL